MSILSQLAVILVEPQQPGNIGMVCRAMANFGVSDLRLVNPCVHLHPEAAKFAVFAKELLGQARIFPDLDAALADLHLSVATTRRSGRLRGNLLPASALPAQLAAQPAATRVGLVFGREDAGLTTEEVARCSLATTIPTHAEQGSLNLAQAVLVLLYELARQPPSTTAEDFEPPPPGALEGVFSQMERVLHRIGFVNPSRPEASLHPLRRLLQRARPDRGETALLRGLWAQLEESVHDWPGKRRGNRDCGGKTG